MVMIDVRQLVRRFDELTAVDAISFHVERGEIFGFLGPNGAGKSTTINMLATLLSPGAGEAFINGFSIRNQRDQVRRSIGLVFQDPSLDDRLTAEENLQFHARLYGVPSAVARRQIEDVLRLVDLQDRRAHLVRTFSGGMKRRLEIARGLIHAPAVLFLDEPTIGLDPQTRAHVWNYTLALKRERSMTIFMTTHYMQEAEVCDRIAIIDHGRIIAIDTPMNLKRLVGGDVVRMRSRASAALKQELERRYQTPVTEEGEMLQLEVDHGEQFLPRLFQELSNPIDWIELRKPTLEDVFLQLTGRTIREEDISTKERLRTDMRRWRRS